MVATDIPAGTADNNRAETTVTSFRIIEALKSREYAGVTELAEELDLAKGTVHKHLNTLRELDYVIKEDHEYRLSLSFLGLGTAVRSRLPVYQEAQRPLENLTAATDEVASLMIPEHGYGIYVQRIHEGDHPNVHVNEGERLPLHATAGGKAILSYTPADERERILDVRGLPQHTENTITDRDVLIDELRMIRDRRTSYDRAEYRENWHCIAQPITNEDNRAIAAVTVSGPAERMEQKDSATDIASLVGSTVNSLQNRFYADY